MAFTSVPYLVGRTDPAYSEYQAWADSVLKYSYDASRSGSKLQTVPLRSALVWQLPFTPSSKMQALPIRNARDWPIRTGLGSVRASLDGVQANQPVLVTGAPLSGVQLVLLGLGAWWVAKKYLGK